MIVLTQFHMCFEKGPWTFVRRRPEKHAGVPT